ncbi:MAG: hypothetical protein UV74_C0013G0568 [Candidatus Woesebacteria bacterium GW2011_GWB1_43_14]|uniref:DNA 3'-5' helicase n=1 Tax=Candidatus Woesebacteria bacterium GW2011_GWB1_43_14 TaxID=1618578 RepID=A0A0G1FQY3_9BACT|nr:MAG: hypothetical protein UT21_C0001G0281 [Candidatus Woesebacteria bacterium GW2011_GWA1_39_11b]KKS77975.1 MAG: hypothetical protein UV51_C0003G0010 [Candidatus Woesebacteria bacterium GW2011_GWC1_42_9]KKS97446.1 MAG: hypothetical protein UV74_C0013G0568 [Candidatus Woesebacteria bacterium GW2011_GWB1_43_14]
MKLNQEQLAAIRHKKGPLLIIAGAGTGKTTVIAERIKFLVTKGGIKPSEILALTFSEKAAREMEERVDVAMPLGFTQMWISTFHSFCDQVLKDEALHVGLDPKFNLFSQTESIQFVRDNLFEFDLDYYRPLGNPDKFVREMLTHFSRLQDEDITPADYIRWVNSKFKIQNLKLNAEGKAEFTRYMELAGAYKKYDELKIKNGCFDFGDLITKTLLLFKSRPNVLDRYQERYKHILVDEYQDVNFAQNKLALLIAEGRKNITVVGDDDQSIYRFRGAAISNITQFKKAYPKAKTVVLTKNYRSGQEILDGAYKLIQSNNPDRLEISEKIDKKLMAATKTVASIRFFHESSANGEALSVAREISKLTKRRYDYSDIAVLVRANNHADAFITAFEKNNLPHQFLGPGKLFQQEEIINIISYLKVLVDQTDSVSLFDFLSSEFCHFSVKRLQGLLGRAKREKRPFYEILRGNDDEKMKRILEMIDRHIELLPRERTSRIVFLLLKETERLEKLMDPSLSKLETEAANIAKLFSRLSEYEAVHRMARVSEVVSWIELASEFGESPAAANIDWSNENAVNILTIHSAKGLEFPVVFLVNLVAGRFPSMYRREQIPIPDELIKEKLPEGDFHLEEERRLFYVGMTRAQEKLYFTAADYYGEGKRAKKLSPFIVEALGDQPPSLEIFNKNTVFPKFVKKEKLPIKHHPLSIHIDFLSYSQIEAFKICPLHYKLSYILKIPTPKTAAQSFGTSIHETLKDFYIALKAGEKPDRRLINRLLSKNWDPEGYKNIAHNKEALKKAKYVLKNYLRGLFNPKINTLAAEQKFIFKLKDLKVGGKIDRIDKQGDTLEVIDYKTGSKLPSQREVDANLQLSIYALAINKINDFPFKKNYKKLKLSLIYLDPLTKITTSRTIDELKSAEKELFNYKKKIEESDFICSNTPICANCEYSSFCNRG